MGIRQSIPLLIILEQPNTGVTFALQKGSGNTFECLLQQQGDGGDLQFPFSVEAQLNSDGSTDFYGPFVQGPRGQRFVYVGIGQYAGHAHSIWNRRLKIPLTGITDTVISAVLNNSDKILTSRVPGKGKDGTPNCATVKPFDGWKLADK